MLTSARIPDWIDVLEGQTLPLYASNVLSPLLAPIGFSVAAQTLTIAQYVHKQ